MPQLSLRQASQAFSVSRQTLGKALATGVISGTKDDKGNWQIDGAELMRVYNPRPQSGRASPPDFTTPAMPKVGPESPLGHALELRLARAEAALDAEREKNALLQQNLDDLRRMLPPPDAPRRQRWWPW